ncbi:MAG: hypothetical protein IPL46_16975 [Saprospiraceae bacterium]|nr:hypothetical protein [Saprospiraceae bacterium]
MKFLMPLLLFFAVALLNSGCKKDADEPTVAHLQIQMDFNVAGQALEFNKDYTIGGTKIRFTAARYYLGGLKITLDNNDVVDFTSQYLLAEPGAGAIVNEPVAISNIKNVKFFVGVDSITNKMSESDFTNRPTGDPLGIQDPSMHWSWNTGYRFLRVDGMADTTGDGIPDTPVEYHLGNNPMLKNIDINTSILIKAGDNKLTFGFDLAQFFAGVDFPFELATHVGDNLPLATKLRDNLPAAMTVN